MKRTFAHRKDKDGKWTLVEIPPRRASFEIEDFETRMVHELHRQECEQGSRFQVPGFTTQQLAEVWPKQ